MITLFNRKELFITYDIQKKSNVCGLLDGHNIDYDVKVRNLTSSSLIGAGSRGRSGTIGVNLANSYEYKIYVKKEDYEIAQEIIHHSGR